MSAQTNERESRRSSKAARCVGRASRGIAVILLGACANEPQKFMDPSLVGPRFGGHGGGVCSGVDGLGCVEGELHHRIVVCVDPFSSPGSYTFTSAFNASQSPFNDLEDDSIDPDLSGFGITQNKLGPYVPGDIITSPVNLTPAQCTDVFVRMTSFQDSANRLWTAVFLPADFNPEAGLDITATIPAGYTYSVQCTNDNPLLLQTAGCSPGPIVANPILSSADVYSGSSVTFKFVAPVLDPPVFVIGDVEPHAVGDVVNFWGAQWGHNNFMSGFVSPGGSFKGYASEVNGSCGGTWETRPGNSSQPPPTIDQPMLLIVTSTVGKNGPVISGNIVQIVQINHDGSYDGNPGHASWGTVNQVICTVD